MTNASQNGPSRRAGPAPLLLPTGGGLPGGPAALHELLRLVIDPEIGINIVDLGLVYEVSEGEHGAVTVRMSLTSPGCPMGGYMEGAIQDVLWGAAGVDEVEVQIVWDPPWDPHAMMSDWAKTQLGWRI